MHVEAFPAAARLAPTALHPTVDIVCMVFDRYLAQASERPRHSPTT